MPITCPHCSKSFLPTRKRPGTIIERLRIYRGTFTLAQLISDNALKDLTPDQIRTQAAQMVRHGAWRRTAPGIYEYIEERKFNQQGKANVTD